MTTYIKGKKIEVSVYFAAILTVMLALSPNGNAASGFICCLLHEAGHLLCMKATGHNVRGVSFGVYGMRIDAGPCVVMSAKKEAIIAVGGPVVNTLLACFGMAFRSKKIVFINIALAVLNLLPIEPTDGYTVIHSLLSLRFEREKIEAALRIVSAAFLFLLYCFGFMVFFKSGYNFSVLAVAFYLTVKFLFQGNRQYR